MINRLSSFKNYCSNNSINILHDDLVFINEKLNKFHRDDYKQILIEYVDEWKRGMDSIENPSLKQSTGRFNANQWLLKKSAKYDAL